MSDDSEHNLLDGHVKRRALAGLRWGLIVNGVTIPLSFLTNVMLARTSDVVLGYYGALQIFAGAFQAFFVPGGRDVFTRFVPRLELHERFAFLSSYLLLVLAWMTAGVAGVYCLVPRLLARALDYFGGPSLAVALSVGVTIVIWAFSSHFLYAVLESPQAAVTLRLLVPGYFVWVALGTGPLRDRFLAQPVEYLWFGALLIYIMAGSVGVVLVTRTTEFRERRLRRWVLPPGFSSVVGYTHLATVVTFAFANLVPSLVLLWLDFAALGRLYAALRYVVLLNALAVVTSPVLAPGIARLEAEGHRERGLSHAATGIRALMLVIYPASLALILFAGDALAVFNPEFRQYRSLLRIVALVPLAGPAVYIGAGTAAALGAFRGYLAASLVFVASSLGLTAVLVPRFGLTGAAVAMSLAALIQQVAVAVVLRVRVGFRFPKRVVAAWGCGALASVVAMYLDPGRASAVVLYLLFLAAFVVAGRVSGAEVRHWLARLLSRE